MNIIEAIKDENLFRTFVTNTADGDLSSWQKWLSFLRVLHGLTTFADEHETIQACTGRDPQKLPDEGFTEALLLVGRRGGKSKMTALVGAAEAILGGKEKNLSRGEIAMVAILSPTRFQSRIIHSYLRGVFDSTPMLRNELAEERRESFVLKNGVEVSILTGDPRKCRGFSVIAAVVDEIAMFGLSEESKVRSDTELIRSIRPSLASTGGRLLAVGTPYAASGYAYSTFKRCFGNDDADILVWNAPTTTMNPTIDTKIIDRAIAEDPIAANVEYCTSVGLFREDVDIFVSRAVVESLVVPGRKELNPTFGTQYAAFADVSGGRSDDAALSIAHKQGRVVVIDALKRYKAPHNPYEVVKQMADVLRQYGCHTCTGDAYAAEWTRQAFQAQGIDYRRASRSEWKTGASAIRPVAKPKSQLYVDLLPRLHSGEIELLDDETLIHQLSSLQRRTRSGGRDTIDHPPGQHDDLANAVAGVVDSCRQRRVTVGSLWRT